MSEAVAAGSPLRAIASRKAMATQQHHHTAGAAAAGGADSPATTGTISPTPEIARSRL